MSSRECRFTGGGPLEGHRLNVDDHLKRYAAPVDGRADYSEIDNETRPPGVGRIVFYGRAGADVFEYIEPPAGSAPEPEDWADWWCPCCGSSWGSIEIDNPEIRCQCGSFCVDASTRKRPAGIEDTDVD